MMRYLINILQIRKTEMQGIMIVIRSVLMIIINTIYMYIYMNVCIKLQNRKNKALLFLRTEYDMYFNTNKIPIEILKKGVNEGTYVRNIYSNVTNKWYNDS